LDALASLRSVHLVEVAPDDETAAAFSRLTADTVEADRRIARLRHVLDLMDHHRPPKRGLAQSFVALPTEVTADTMRRALDELDVETLDEHITRLSDEAMALGHRVDEIHVELAHLALWESIDCSAPMPCRWCQAALGCVGDRMRRLMDESEKIGDTVFIHELGRGRDNRALLQVVALKEHEDAFNDFLRQFEFTPLPVPPGISVRDMIRALHVELSGYDESLEAIRASIAELVGKHREQVVAVLGDAETRRDVTAAREKALHSTRMVLVTGYARARDTDRVHAKIHELVPQAGVVFREPALEENVPVELRTSRFFGPSTFLTSMFGLPPYRDFDPSPHIMFFFLTFFGFCFGDVVYGIALLLFSLHVMKKLKNHPSTANFFKLFAWGGVFTIIAGVLMGSWASDLPAVLEEAYGITWFNRIRTSLMVIDPIRDPVTLLLVALGVGVLSQFWGIFLAMHRDLRRGDVKGAVYDGGLWYITLPGFIMLAAGLFSPPVPPWVPRMGLWIFCVGAVGLILTQGRKEKSFAGKAITGVVSIYGIIGSYGVTVFLGDTLSYARLLALGLVTGVVGYSFNLMASMLRDIPYIGVFAFVLVVLAGHTLNFFISVLGGFVHSARLIFLEVFGRFYESGGKQFAPLGITKRLHVTD
ncbi:MAG TPA: hypothetical protein VMY39_04880, partial [Planctomycetota bacterium]|nr:hypothetical protein [Planctomycetota bacterium]